MLFQDALILDAPRRTKEGFLAVRAKAARAGVYDYLGSEVDPEGKHFKATDVVKVYRPESEVFDKASVGSFFAKPITDNHPSVPVTQDNWRDHARGAVMGAMKDGEYLAFDLALMDASAIAAVESGKRELSNGYACDLAFEDGQAPDGTAYQAVQRNIRGNHVAIVDRGRAGSECSIKDRFALCDANPAVVGGLSYQEKPVKTITLDGLPVNLGDVAAVEAAIVKLQGIIADTGKSLTEASTALSTKDGEIVALKAKLADAEKASSPEVLDQRVADRAALVAKAKAVKADIVTDGKTDADIRKAVVVAKIGDAAAAMDDAAINGAFAVVTADVKTVDQQVANIGTPHVTGDARAEYETARAKAKANLSDAWRGSAAAAA